MATIVWTFSCAVPRKLLTGGLDFALASMMRDSGLWEHGEIDDQQ